MYVFRIPAPTPNYLAEVIGQLVGVPWLVALTVSTLWIVYRVFLVFQKPTEDLEEILGIDIPPIPDVALARINTDSVLLYWKPPDNYPSQLKHLIQVNGINVGAFEKTDATIQVTGLQPGNCYGIRAVATNQAGNSSYSGLIQVQTIPSKDGSRASKLLAEVADVQAKQSTQIRRTSQLQGLGDQSQASNVDEGDAKEEQNDSLGALDPLTKRMNSLKQQLAEVQRQIAEEKKEAEASKSELTMKRDDLKSSVEDSEKSSQEFRRQVNELEKQCKGAQRKKSAKERSLQQKKAGRQKMRDEIARWEVETQDIYQSARQSREQKANLDEEHAKQMETVKKKIEEAQVESARMEEELREVGIKVKELDEQRAKADQEKYAAEAEAEKRKEEEDQAAENRIQELQIQYSTWWKMITDLEVQRDMEAEKVADLLRYKDQNPSMFAPVPGLDYPIPPMFPTNRRPRNQISRGNTLSQPNYTANHHHNPTFDSTSSASPSFSAPFPLYSLAGHGSPEKSERKPFTQQEIESLTGGAPMSPSANTLLPSNLLGDDDDPRAGFGRSSSPQKESVNSRPQSFRPSSTDPKAQDPQSPLSTNSKSPSLLSSPHESFSNLPNIYSRDRHLDDDERSLPPHSSPFSVMPAIPTSGAGSSRKISSLFNWSRREKVGLSEPPLLGTLKQGQSQSFPANGDEDDDINSSGRRPGWANQVSNLWSKTGGTHAVDPHQLPRKTRRGVFGTRIEGSDSVGESSRPSSTYSFGENLMQQPQDFQHYAWGTSESARHRGNHFVYEWPTNNSGPWSHTQSRRASIQHGSTSNLSLGSTPLDPAEEYPSPYLFKKMNQPAPIGTERFKISQKPNTPKLNPAAPSFTTRLFNRGESKKTPRSEKFNEFTPEKLLPKESDKTRDLEVFSKSSSPSVSRKSHDAYSVVTADSLGESHESLEPSNSATPSEPALTPNTSTPKETLMQRLQRKSSSTKFWSKDRSSKASSKGAPSTPGEIDFEDGGDYLGRSLESASGTPQDKSGRGSLSWSRVMGKTKKKGDPAPSESSERASEADGDEDE